YVCYQSLLNTQCGAAEGGVGVEHLPHSRTAFRPLIANDEHIAARDMAGEDGVEAVLLAVEDPRRTGHPRRLHARDLRHAPFTREVAAQDGEMTLSIERSVPRADDL